jgi:Bardet-Biedl syndrome 2 protein
VSEFNNVRQKLTAELADQSNLVKGLIVRAEDYRLLDDL